MYERIIATHAFTNQGTSVTIVDDDGAGNVAAFDAAKFTGSMNLRFRIAASNKALWVKLFKGDVVAATAGTAGELHVPAGTVAHIVLEPAEYDGLSIIGEDNTVDGSVSIVVPA